MPLLPNEEAVELAVGEALVLAFAGQVDVAAAVAAGSIYFGPTDDPRAPRPACRVFETSQVVLGREAIIAVPQKQQWLLELLAVGPGPYTVTVKDAAHTYPAQPADDAAAIIAGLVDAFAGDTNATAAPGPDEGQLVVDALEDGEPLGVKVTANMSSEVTRDRATWQGAAPAERTYSFNLATVMSPTAPTPRQHALTYAKLLRGRIWHADVLDRLRVAGIVPRRIAAGPVAVDELVDNVTETRAVLEVVFSITAGAAVATPVMESASGTATLEMEHP